MADVLATAKEQQRHFAMNYSVTIRLALLEDLIAEIEALRSDRDRPLKAVVDLAAARNTGGKHEA